MTTASFYHADGTLELIVDGHAGFNALGEDIVCAACSMLAHALMYAVSEQSGIELYVSVGSGNFHLTCPATADTLPMFRMAQAGYAALAQNYPENVAQRGEIPKTLC